jgi:hypothetical protein
VVNHTETSLLILFFTKRSVSIPYSASRLDILSFLLCAALANRFGRGTQQKTVA